MRGTSSIAGRLAADISLSVCSYGEEVWSGRQSTEQFLDAAVGHGFSAVELLDRSIRDPDAVRIQLADRHLTVPSVAVRSDFTGAAGTVAASVDHVRTWASIAADLDCRLVRVWTGWQADGPAVRRQIAEAMAKVVASAVDVGVTVAVETHGGASNDPEFMVELCRPYPRDVLGVCLDFGNLPAPTRRDAIERLAPVTNHVHVKSYEFDADGRETTVPLEWAVRTVSATGFDAQWVIEYEGAPPHDEGIVNTVRVLASALDRDRHPGADDVPAGG